MIVLPGDDGNVLLGEYINSLFLPICSNFHTYKLCVFIRVSVYYIKVCIIYSDVYHYMGWAPWCCKKLIRNIANKEERRKRMYPFG